jgi:hypothetical protein
MATTQAVMKAVWEEGKPPYSTIRFIWGRCPRARDRRYLKSWEEPIARKAAMRGGL